MSTRVWMIWLEDPSDRGPWLEAAVDDDTSAETDRWERERARVRELARENKWEMRIQEVEVPGVGDLFEIPTVTAVIVEELAAEESAGL